MHFLSSWCFFIAKWRNDYYTPFSFLEPHYFFLSASFDAYLLHRINCLPVPVARVFFRNLHSAHGARNQQPIRGKRPLAGHGVIDKRARARVHTYDAERYNRSLVARSVIALETTSTRARTWPIFLWRRSRARSSDRSAFRSVRISTWHCHTRARDRRPRVYPRWLRTANMAVAVLIISLTIALSNAASIRYITDTTSSGPRDLCDRWVKVHQRVLREARPR